MSSTRWSSFQTPHGGQEWRDIENYVEDFSVTTNGLGPPAEALKAALASMHTIQHYPPADTQPSKTHLACFLSEGLSNQPDLVEKLVIGNGASELIDLAIRTSTGQLWTPGPFNPQYKEYERAALLSLKQKSLPNEADLHCIVNPCNPTGEFLNINDMTEYIETNAKIGSTVIVDESMLPWLGPSWRLQSLVSQGDWIDKQLRGRNVNVMVIHSWTKLWACPGLRIGSIILPSVKMAEEFNKRLVPWSTNSVALAFLSAATMSGEYMEETWNVTAAWRSRISEALEKAHPSWKFYGESWTSYIWIDVLSADVARACVEAAKDVGCPIRAGEAGYGFNSCIRIAVRNPKYADILIEKLCDIKDHY